MILHEAIFKLNPTIVTIVGDIAYDKDNNEVQYDLDAAKAELDRFNAEQETAKQTAEAKLAKLGLTVEDLKALLG